jgi:hypothetical protein
VFDSSKGKGKVFVMSSFLADALKSTPIAAVGQQAAEKAQAVQGLITGQTKVIDNPDMFPQFPSPTHQMQAFSGTRDRLRVCGRSHDYVVQKSVGFSPPEPAVSSCADIEPRSLIGFGLCLASGIFFTALSTLMLPFIVIKPHKFAVAYSVGNLLMLAR